MLSQSVNIKKIPALVIVTSQQGLIWRVQGSPQRKLNFLLICTTILIISLLIRIPWQTRHQTSPVKTSLKSPNIWQKMSCRWPPPFKTAVASSLNNCSDRSEAFDLTSRYKLYRCTMHAANQALWECPKWMRMSNAGIVCWCDRWRYETLKSTVPSGWLC